MLPSSHLEEIILDQMDTFKKRDSGYWGCYNHDVIVILLALCYF